MYCENCSIEHTGDYGSGRFCSCKCARGFSTKANRQDINLKVSKSLSGRKQPIDRVSVEKRKEATEKSKITWTTKILESDFNDLSYESKRKRIIIEQKNCCNHCSISEWKNKPITLEIDHINGINDDNRRENLEAICPNCHSVTDTWRGRNKPSRNGDNTVNDAELISALKETKNIRQALLSVGLAAKGNNYKRAKKLLIST